MQRRGRGTSRTGVGLDGLARCLRWFAGQLTLQWKEEAVDWLAGSRPGTHAVIWKKAGLTS